jgi:hypothetical protein
MVFSGGCKLISTGQTIMKVKSKTQFALASAAAAALVVAGMTSLTFSRIADATPQFAKDTGKDCGACHVSATGGGKLTDFGEKFKANGNKLP